MLNLQGNQQQAVWLISTAAKLPIVKKCTRLLSFRSKRESRAPPGCRTLLVLTPYSPGRPPTLIQAAGLAGGPCQPGHNGKDRVWWRHIVNEEGRLLCVTGIQERVCIIYQRECIISGCNKDAGSETPVGPEMESAAKKPNRQLTSCGGRSLLSTDVGYLVPPITTHQSPT